MGEHLLSPPPRSRHSNQIVSLTLDVNEVKTIKKFLNDESGMETLEYAVIAGLIAVVAVAVYATGGQWRTNLENRLLGATNAS